MGFNAPWYWTFLLRHAKILSCMSGSDYDETHTGNRSANPARAVELDPFEFLAVMLIEQEPAPRPDTRPPLPPH